MKKLLFLIISSLIFTHCFGGTILSNSTKYDSFTNSRSSRSDKYNPDEFVRIVSARDAVKITPITGMTPGVGYASDIQSIAPTACYNQKIKTSSITSIVDFHNPRSSPDMAGFIGMPTSHSIAAYSLLHGGNLTNYFASLKTTWTSLTLNYVYKLSTKVSLEYDPNDLLNETGKEIYQNGATPMFRLFCGDKLVDSYEEAGLLIMSIQLNFSDNLSLVLFERYGGSNIRDMSSAFSHIGNIARKFNLKGTIRISAYQLSGNPAELSRILQGNILLCDLQNALACQGTVNNMLNYAHHGFFQQFENKDNSWIVRGGNRVPPTGNISLGKNVSDLGIKLAPSYADGVSGMRQNLFDNYKGYDLGVSRTEGLLNYISHQPLPQPNNLTEADVNLLRHQNPIARNHMHILLHGVYSGGLVDCVRFPFRCKTIYDEVNARVPNFNSFNWGKVIYSCKSPNDFPLDYMNQREICPRGDTVTGYRWSRAELDASSVLMCKAFAQFQILRMPHWYDCNGHRLYPRTIWSGR